MITAILAILGMIGVLVVVHEAGHFVVARIFGIGAPVFSVGFGPRLFGFVYKGTDYRVSAVPFGGYVRMAGADPFGEEDPDAYCDPDENFMLKPVWQRLLVMLAGPAANIVLPFVLFSAVLMMGEPQATSDIGLVVPGTAAAEAGVEVGDRVVAVDGKPVETWVEMTRSLADYADTGVKLSVERSGSPVQINLPPSAIKVSSLGLVDHENLGMWHQKPSPLLGISDPSSPFIAAGFQSGDVVTHVDGVEVNTWYDLEEKLGSGSHEIVAVRAGEKRGCSDSTETIEGRVEVGTKLAVVHGETFVGRVEPDSAADEAGILPGDRILAVDGTEVRSWTDLLKLVSATVEGMTEADTVPRSLTVVLLRDAEEIELTFTPKVIDEVRNGVVQFRPIMGLLQFPGSMVAGPRVTKYYGPTVAIPRAFEEGSIVFRGTMNVLVGTFTGKLAVKKAVGGPVKISKAAKESAEMGLFAYLRMMGMISFSLGILNLLPVPALDGGQIMFFLIEAVRGKPLPLELREKVQMVGVLLLASFMLVVTVWDIEGW